jgi:GTP cyclohydrolase I
MSRVIPEPPFRRYSAFGSIENFMDTLEPMLGNSTPENSLLNTSKPKSIVSFTNRPSREEAMKAVKTLLAWAGDDPEREGLIDTPKRVVDAYEEWFQGYQADPKKELSRTFEDVQGYDDMVMLREIDVESHCEHHMAPFLGKAWVAYMPTSKVVGISKIARVVEIFAKRLQTQETMTKQVADALEESLAPLGVAVLIDAEHQCMSTRGVHHKNVTTVTTRFTGVFKTDQALQDRFLRLIHK